jgi:glutamate 5-kinase
MKQPSSPLNIAPATDRNMERTRSVVVKVGSAVLTSPEGLHLPVLRGLVDQLARLARTGRRVTLVSSGAVAAGRAALAAARGLFPGCMGMAERQAAAAIGQGRLMREYEDAFAAHGILCAQVLLTREDLRSRSRFLHARNTFGRLLDWGVVPVVNENDTVAVQELKFGDNDALASLLLNLVESDLCINLTSSGGVLSRNPPSAAGQEDIPVLREIADIQSLDIRSLCGEKTSAGTGGMYSKLLAARRAAQLGVPTLILPGREPGIIDRAFAGESAGTWIAPAPNHVSRRKYWLAYQTEPQGRIFIDAGAARALLEQGGSLLPGGVRGVEGAFSAGSLVSLAAGPQSLGVGLSNYAAGDLRRIMGLRRHEIAALLGDAHYPEVIHRDNLLLHAAV